MADYYFDATILYKLFGQGDQETLDKIFDDLDDHLLDGRTLRFTLRDENGRETCHKEIKNRAMLSEFRYDLMQDN
jgi:hypothetical protein